MLLAFFVWVNPRNFTQIDMIPYENDTFPCYDERK